MAMPDDASQNTSDGPSSNSDDLPGSVTASMKSTPESGTASAYALLELGCRQLQSNNWNQAVTHLRQAADQCPDDPMILEKLATAYHRGGELLSALKVYDRLIELDAASAAVWCATGNALTDVGEYAQAIGAYQASLSINHQNPEAHHNLGRVLYRLGDVDRAANHLEIAASQCDSIAPWLSLAVIIPGCPRASPEQILNIRTTFARKLATWTAAAGAFESPDAVRKKSDKVLRVGYLSAFFHNANYMKPVWGLINHHDRTAFEIHLFSDSPIGNRWAGYQRHADDRLHPTDQLDNAELANLIQSSGIDILVDLNAYSTASRLPLFLQHIAPVTVAWFNMYATSGLPAFDYIVGDAEVVRDGEERFYTEQVVRLPLSYLTFEVTHPTPPVVAPPCLTTGHVTFGSLVSQYKITPPVLDAWSEVLRRTEYTRLILANRALKSACNREYVWDQFIRRGVQADRLALEGPEDHFSFLKKYDRIDVALDAFPYNGGTTTMEAIWQGVPVVACAGDRWASRTSQSLLRNAELGEFVAEDVEGFVHRAVELACDPSVPARLSRLRLEMRRRLQRSAVCDTRALARQIEQFYLAAWSRQTDCL